MVICLLSLLLQGIALYAQPDTADLRRLTTRLATMQRQMYGQGTGSYDMAFYLAALQQKDSAFYYLHRWFDGSADKGPEVLGMYPFRQWHHTPEWKAFEKMVTDTFLHRSAGLQQPRLALQLLAARGLDQSVRFYGIFVRNDPRFNREVQRIDSQHITLMRKVIAKYGYPGISMVGAEACQGAFLLCQHADDDLPFQKQVLRLMQQRAGDVPKKNIAYLTDRIMVAEEGRQLYGTQMCGRLQPCPIVDSARVDERRREMGLGTMKEYLDGGRLLFGQESTPH
jgi:hypothetical protein